MNRVNFESVLGYKSKAVPGHGLGVARETSVTEDAEFSVPKS